MLDAKYLFFSACLENEYRCGDGKCIPPEYICDAVFQCEDHTDEINCGNNY